MVRYSNPADDNPRRIIKADKDFVKRLDFKDITFPGKIRDIHKIEKKSSIAIIQDNTKQNPNESYANKCKKHTACSYGYKLVCVHDKFSKPFKSYLGKDAVYNFISTMIEESKYCGDVMKKHFNKELVVTKNDNEDFENSSKYWICDNDYIDNDVKVRDHCRITGKKRGSPHRDCNVNVKLNHKISVVIRNLKNYDSHLIMSSGIWGLLVQTGSGFSKFLTT